MTIVSDKNAIIDYLRACLTRERADSTTKLKLSLERPENKIAFTKSMVERIEEEIKDEAPLLYEFQAFIKEIFDNGRVSSNSSDIENEKADIYNLYSIERRNGDVLVIVSDEAILDSEHISVTCCLYEYELPNRSWMILNLLANCTLTARYIDFKNDAQIRNFFEDFFKLNTRVREVWLIDSYCNLHRNGNFEILKRGYIVKVFSSAYRKNRDQTDRFRSDIKSFFGGRSTSVKFSTDNSLTHERLIMIGNFVLESNHDFAEILRRNSNWKLDISYSQRLREENAQKCARYN